MANSWRTAYFKQALADYEMFLLLEKTANIPVCHRLHYLQMTPEKLAKGFGTPLGAKKAHPHTHAEFVQLLRNAKSQSQFHQARGTMSKMQFDARINGLCPLAEKIQRLAPDLAGTGPNPEYPWEIPQGILVPIEFSFTDIDLNANVNPKLRNLLKFIDICFDIAKRELGDT